MKAAGISTLAIAFLPLTSGQNLRAITSKTQARKLDPIFAREVAEVEADKSCGKLLKYAQQWTTKSASEVEAGLLWSFQGELYDRRKGGIVGSATEVCTKIDRTGMTWICEGTVVNPDGCDGQFSYAGSFSEEIFEGNYVITSGTGQFEGVTGTVMEKFGPKNLVSRFQVSIN